MASSAVSFDIIARDKASATFTKVGDKAQSTSDRLKKFGTIAAAGVTALGAATVLSGKYFFSTSARLEQMATKAKTVFGGQLPIVENWSRKSAAAMGLTRREATGLAANFADLLIPMGFTRKAAAGMSTDIVGLSGALSQWTGGTKSAAEVSEILASAMLGETDGLKALGISISAADVQAQILKRGQDKLTGATRQQAEAQAIQRLIFQKSTDAQAAFAKGGSPLLSAQARIKARLGEVRDTIAVKLIPAFASAADWASAKIPKAIATMKHVLGTVRGTISKAFSKLDLSNVREAFSNLDIKGVGAKLAKQAKAWAAPVIAGFSVGLNTGDWSSLGRSLGTGIVRALQGLGEIVADLTKALGDFFGKVDWVGIGITMGKQAPSLLAGLAVGILNFDLGGLLKGLAGHWQDVLFAVITVAFTPAKVIGKVGQVLAKIPFVGKLLEWALLHFKKFSDGLVGMVGKALKALGGAFLSGFRKVFPGIGDNFAKSLALLPLRLQLMALELEAKALKMMAKLAGAIAKGILWVVAKIGELTAKMLKPFAKAGSWLINVGKDLIRGLISGIASMAGELVSTITHSVTDKIPGFIKDRLGIHSPSRVLSAIGVNLMEGLVQGIEKGGAPLQRVLDKLTTYIERQGQKISDLMSKRSDIISSFGGFTSSVFTAEPREGEKATPESLLAYQKAELAKANRLKANVRKLLKMGLSRDLIQQLAASGESGLAQINALAGGSSAQVQQLNALNAQTHAALTAAGTLAGNDLYASDIKDAKNAERIAQAIAKALTAEQRKHPKDEIHIHLEGKDIVYSINKYQHGRGKKDPFP